MLEALHKSKQISAIALDRLGDYFELLRIELKLQGQEMVMQLLGYAVAALFAALAAIFIGVAIIVTYWDSPYRTAAAWVAVLLYVAVAVGGIMFSRRQKHAGSAISTLRNELKQDVELVKETI